MSRENGQAGTGLVDCRTRHATGWRRASLVEAKKCPKMSANTAIVLLVACAGLTGAAAAATEARASIEEFGADPRIRSNCPGDFVHIGFGFLAQS